MAGERGVDRDVGGFRIPNLTHHDDVGGLTQHRAKRGCETHADVGLDHHLIDAGQLVFNRILDRDDLLIGLVDDVETGVERGGLTRTSRAGNQQDAIRQTQQAFKALLVVRKEAELRQTK